MSRRVLHVSQPVDAGVPEVLLAYAAHSLAAGADVVIACPAEGPLAARARAQGLRVLAWEAGRDPGPGVAGEVRALQRVLATCEPDLVHLHSAKAGLAGRLAIRGRVPTVFQPHAWSFLAVTGVRAALARRWEVAGARWTHRLVAVSESELRAGRAAGVRGAASVVANGVDLARFAPPPDAARATRRAALGLDAAPVAVCVGRLCRQKGQDVALAAWPEVRRRCPDATLVLVGDGPDRAALEAAATHGVRFAGRRDDVPAWLAAADLVVAPSRWEGQSLALLEAMASGASIVAAEVAGVRDALPADGGAVVGVDDPRALADAIATRFADPARRAAEGAANRRAACAGHDVARSAAAIEAIYDELVPPAAS